MFDVQVGVTVSRTAAVESGGGGVLARPRFWSTMPRLMPGSRRATSRRGDTNTPSPQCSGARYSHSAHCTRVFLIQKYICLNIHEGCTYFVDIVSTLFLTIVHSRSKYQKSCKYFQRIYSKFWWCFIFIFWKTKCRFNPQSFNWLASFWEMKAINCE